MKTFISLSILFFTFLVSDIVSQGASINADGSSPHTSAMLEIKSNNKGMLLPRMTTDQRTSIDDPATGLVVFDTDAGGFWFYTGTGWKSIASTNVLSDEDQNTKVMVEENSNEDKIRFDLAGTEYFVMDGPRLEVKNSGYSLFLGEGAGLNDNLDDNHNIFIGHNAGNANTTGSGNTAVGPYAMFLNTSGSDNTVLGISALRDNTTGTFNVAIGQSALSKNTTANSNTAVGLEALRDNTTGHSNTATGWRALGSNTTGNSNTSMGILSMYNNLTGGFNTAYGLSALSDNTTGGSNTAIGRGTLTYSETGSSNVALGSNAGNGGPGISFTQCTFLGALSSPTVARTNVIMLGYGIANGQCTANNQVLLGNTSIAQIRAQVTSITSYSDARFKTNISENIKGLDFINRLRPVSYNVRPAELHKIWGTPDSLYSTIDHSDIEKVRFSGFIAQEVEVAARQSNFDFTGIDIPSQEGDVYALRYTEFIMPLIKATQELSDKNNQLEHMVASQELRIEELLSAVGQLQDHLFRLVNNIDGIHE